MTRKEQRRIKQAIREITVSVVETAMRSGVYHEALEKAIGPIRCGTDAALTANQECSEELLAQLGRAGKL